MITCLVHITNPTWGIAHDTAGLLFRVVKYVFEDTVITWVRVGGFTPIEMLRGVNGLSKTPAGSGIMFWSEYKE